MPSFFFLEKMTIIQNSVFLNQHKHSREHLLTHTHVCLHSVTLTAAGASYFRGFILTALREGTEGDRDDDYSGNYQVSWPLCSLDVHSSANNEKKNSLVLSLIHLACDSTQYIPNAPQYRAKAEETPLSASMMSVAAIPSIVTATERSCVTCVKSREEGGYRAVGGGVGILARTGGS